MLENEKNISASTNDAETNLMKKIDAVKVIVCDLDGTLLNSEKLISPVTMRAVNAARERGIFVTICTGRVPEMMEAYIRMMNINGPVITANGSVIVDTRDHSVPYRECADNEACAKVLAFCARRNFDHIATSVEGCYYSRGSKRIKRFEQYNTIAQQENLKEISLIPFDDYNVVNNLHIYKLLIAGLSNDEQNELEAYVKTFPSLAYTSSDKGLFDVGASTMNKGNGVRNLARVMGISADEVCVFGDYENDVPMFEAAGVSFAMGNADDSVKAAASFITKTNDEDGVAFAIERYFLHDK